ncbi:uncharacterized protein M6B38_314675 [Iris pallida]|uniref:Uncharacterized protein n=1 Tax=Iris pallida TaxID=29817 RepID=A0AAX6HEF5_IRIPA|nr:uncharacterized protein M6B38_314675 [Iris pallida]
MTDVTIVAKAGNKRRLPTWMQQVNAADKLRKSGNPDENGCSSEAQPETKSSGSKIPVSRKPDKMLAKESNSRNESEILQGCERKQRGRNASRRDGGPRKSINSSGGAKKKLKKETGVDGKKVCEIVSSKMQHGKSERPQIDYLKSVSPEMSDEEIELTIDDLMSIAKEYVSADRENKQEYQASRESTSRLYPLSSVTSEADMKGPLQANGSSKILSKCLASSCISHLTETEGKGKENPKTENIAINIIRTGDAAQDMLNLFLGPLLKKPPPKERVCGVLESEGLLSIDKSDKEVRDMLLSEEAPVVKKKSSLKDKVAMFLE